MKKLLGGVLSVVLLIGALVVMWLMQHPTTLQYQNGVAPAFSQGGLTKGTGGQVASSAYTQVPSMTSQARSMSSGLLPMEAYPSADTCGQCHVSIKEHWQYSMHSISGTDEWYLKVKELFVFEKGANAVQFCAGCHAPVSLMTGEVGLYNRESKGAQSGVTCVFCHTVHEVNGGNAQYVSDPGRIRTYGGVSYLNETNIPVTAHLVMANPGLHKEDMMRPFYRTSEFCQSCHELEINGIKTQSTYTEWKNSAYASEGITCQACHFTPGAGVNPEEGKLVEHYPKTHKRVLKHTLGGGSTVSSPQAKSNRALLKESVDMKVTLSKFKLKITVSNVAAGHSIPTGVGDLREMWLEVVAKNSADKAVFSSGVTDAGGHLPAGTFVFRQVFVDEAGHPLSRHDQWRVAGIAEDTRIPAKSSRTVEFNLPAGTTNVQVRLLWRDASQLFVNQVLENVLGEDSITELAYWKKPR